ncbi:MAG: hypothetical protein V7K26_25815 [Nostoc sp.]
MSLRKSHNMLKDVVRLTAADCIYQMISKSVMLNRNHSCDRY